MNRRQLLAAAVPLLARPAIAQPARTLRYVPASDLASLDPLWSSATISVTHGYMVWDTLFAIDQDMNPRLQMAESAEVSDDERTWTIRLRENLVFHDGEPVRATDCVASLKRWMEKDPFGQAIAAAMDSMRAVDDRTFRIALTRPFRQLPFAIGCRYAFVMPERIAATPSSTQFKEVVGSGPYRFLADQWQAGARAAYARFDRYVPRSEAPSLWSGAKVAHFDRIEWITQPDPSTAAAALQQSQVDWLGQPLLDLVPLLQRVPGIKVEALDPFGALAILRFNHLQPPFDNPLLRRALLPAIDQEAVVTAVVGEQKQFGTRPVGFFTAGSPMANPQGMEALTAPRDMALARRLIAESGYKGERIVMLAPSDLPSIMAANQVVQDLLSRLGLNIDFQVMDWGTMIARTAKRGPVSEGGWNCYCVTWAGLTASTPGSSYPLRANGTGAPNGWPSDPVLEGLRDQWLETADQTEQKAIAAKIQARAFDSLPFVPLGQWTQPSAYRASLTGILRSPFQLFWNARFA